MPNQEKARFFKQKYLYEMNAATNKVFLVDDHEIFRNGLKELVDSEPDMEIIREAGDGETALQTLSSVLPDVVVMDIRMPGAPGLYGSAISGQ